MRASPLKKVVRRARRVPGYRKVRRVLLARVRDSDTASDIVTRVFAGNQQKKSRVPQRFPTAGNLLAGTGVDLLPVTVVSLIGVPEERIAPAVAEIARCQLLWATFRPVFVLDRPSLGATRPFGYAAELLIEPERWNFHNETWEEYAAARLQDVVRRYGASAIVVVPPEGVTDAIRASLSVRFGA